MTAPDTPDVGRLREVAKAATPAYEHWMETGKGPIPVADFIRAFDPSTCIWLLDRIEAADEALERNFQRTRQWVDRAEEAETRLAALRAEIKGLADSGDRMHGHVSTSDLRSALAVRDTTEGTHREANE